MPRPTFIELSDSNSRSASSLSKNGLTSPRIQHFDGDVPPALSPLDALAARSRKLARDLEETRKAGERRMSRLPPQVVTESLTEHQNTRPTIFRALSEGGDAVPPLPHIPTDRAGSFPRLANPTNRPTSQHAQVSAAFKPIPRRDSKQDVVVERSTEDSKDFFDAPRVDSPPPLEPQTSQTVLQTERSNISQRNSTSSHPDLTLNLAPPRSLANRLRPYHDASDDDYTNSNADSTFSQSRELSASSGFSAPQSPISAYDYSHARSPSSNSVGSPSRPNTRNFSRPMSSASMQNLRGEKSPIRPTISSHLRQSSSFDGSNAPRGFMAGQASSYTHSVYNLPRGRRVSDRTSGIFSGLAVPHFEWQEPMFPGTPPLEGKKSHDLPIPSPMSSARPSRDDHDRSGVSFELNTERGLTGISNHPSSSYTPNGSLRSNESNATHNSTGLTPPKPSQFIPPLTPLSPVEEMSLSSRSNSTVRPVTARSAGTYQGLPAEDHVSKAIDLHEKGSLKESTYHLRIAANKGHPTGMLLYALACRHGWGMRTNPKEGVQWLRKAVDSAMLEVADDQEQKSGSDIHEQKTHRAQFALSIYELGMSHLHGWGTEVDKSLALRCFEIAGNWGDTDALTEAGFCYAQGIGCKKDMKKAAKFYRLAEAKGVSMIGNSWIHKEKYNDTDAVSETSVEKSSVLPKTSSEKPRSKSKPRGIFGRKKSVHT